MASDTGCDRILILHFEYITLKTENDSFNLENLAG